MAIGPIIGGIGALGSLMGGIGGLFGAGRNNAIQEAQTDLAFKDYYFRKMLAERQLEMAQAGQRDARGNTIQYVPGMGWIETPSDTTRGLISASDAEERRRLTEDAIRRRLIEGNQFSRQLQEGADADALRSGMDVNRRPMDAIRASLANRYVSEAMVPVEQAASRNGMDSLRGTRTNAPGIPTNALVRAALARASADAPIEFESQNTARDSGRMQLYNTLASRATTPIGQPAAPTTVDDSLLEALSRRIGSAASVGYAGYGMRAPEVRGINDQRGTAVAGLGGMLESLANNKRFTGMLDSLFGNSGNNTNNPLPLTRGQNSINEAGWNLLW